uniref:Uncharacterized protein n=1 Tax=Chromulina nebulosa TaxID=96789 RepID=A0A7S0SUW2_9STRA|mmetsp:Transcript_4281/g.3834  ORF Transcript_4281/g.3834 Transcript_4281/m.3834 type:complete len:296 (+) Transcript_4281:15-902(+)
MYDLNVKHKFTNEKERKNIIKRLIEFGWDYVAWNTTANGKVNINENRPAPKIELDQTFINSTLKQRSLLLQSNDKLIAFKQYTRITLTIDELSDAQLLTTSNESIRNFDIVAVCPGNVVVFNYLCKQADIDIISLDFSRYINFLINKKLVDEAINRGIMFEITYSPLLLTPSLRRELIANTAVIIKYLRCKNIIITSGSEKFEHIRGPMDVITLANILNISNETARKCIGENCERVINHSVSRKLRFNSIEVLPVKSFVDKYPDIHITINENEEIPDTQSINTDSKISNKKRKRK